MDAADPSRAARRARLKRWMITLSILTLAALAIVALGLHGARKTSASAANSAAGGRRGGDLPVAVQRAQRASFPVYLNALGTVTPLATATVHSQISGQLMEVRFKEGELVKAGAPLALIDPRPYEAQIQQYRGALQRDRAQLENARLDAARYLTLVGQDSVSKQTYDTQQALVKQYEGTVQVDEAQLATAQLNLRYCNVVAPISGRLGLRQVDPGNYVSPSDSNGLVVITQVAPISVVFSLPEDQLPALQPQLATGHALAVEAYDRAQAQHLASGTLTVLDNQIDASTGTVKLRAQFDNRDNALFPNQFVNVRLLLQTRDDVVIVPTSAIERSSQGSFVYVLGADRQVHMTLVKLGPVDGERVVIESGLSGGEQVVTDGADQLKDGQSVTIAGAPPAAGAASAGSGDKPHRRRAPGGDS